MLIADRRTTTKRRCGRYHDVGRWSGFALMGPDIENDKLHRADHSRIPDGVFSYCHAQRGTLRCAPPTKTKRMNVVIDRS